jgi:hypothetical protein
MSTAKHYANPATPIINGEYRNDTTGARQHLGIGMAWQPGADRATLQLQQEQIRIRLHLPSNPAATAFEMQVSERVGFNDPARTSAPGPAAFVVTDGVAQFQFPSYTPQNTTVYPGAVVFANYPGKQFYVRVRLAAGPGPWSVVGHAHPYFPSADDKYALSGLPFAIPAV